MGILNKLFIPCLIAHWQFPWPLPGSLWQARWRPAEAYFGMVAPFAYLKARVLDASTLAVLRERTATFSYPVVRPSTQPSGMETWAGVSKDDKLANIRQAVNGAIGVTLPAIIDSK